MFEVEKPSASNKSIRMSDSLIEKLEKIAFENDVSFNQLVNQCCEYAISHMYHSDDIAKRSDHLCYNKTEL